jgi:hypothetical protein
VNDLDLARKYEPVLLFSKDNKDREESFFPFSTAHYVAESALHKKGTGIVKARGAVSLADLAATSPKESQEFYLTFAADDILEHDPSLRNQLSHGGLAMFGIEEGGTPGEEDTFAEDDDELPAADVDFGLVDGAMQLPHDVHEKALERYAPYRDFSKYPPVYYYSTLKSRGYQVLQYWFFYAYNDWGTGHGGVNDHEGDWEMIALFLRGGEPKYMAYSAHTGAPEHHAWNSNEIHKVGGTHPVVYVGSGSHANYFHSTTHEMFGYKDFAFGNSAVSIGPGKDVPWGEPTDLGAQSWALNFAGGWGAMVKRFGSASLAPGAQSPVGPPWQFGRWEAPVGWAKVPLP